MRVSVLITWETPTVNSCSSEDDKTMGVHPHRPLRLKPKDDPWASALPRFVFLKGVLLALQSQGRKQVHKGTIIFMSKQNLSAQEKPILDGCASSVAHAVVPTVPSPGVSSGCEPGLQWAEPPFPPRTSVTQPAWCGPSTLGWPPGSVGE